MADSNTRILRRSRRTIFSKFLRARWRFGGKTVALTDADGRELTYGQLVQTSFALGRVIAKHTKRGEKVGVLLPTGAGAVVAFFSILASTRVPAMLNFTAGPRNLKRACEAAEITKIITAHQFIEVANLERLEESLKKHAELLYVEDLREEVGLVAKLTALIGPYLPWAVRFPARPSDPGVILFTSGTEGDPKGVVLTHSNVLANVEQINEHVWLEPSDKIFNPLPTFHCYGLTAGTLWPILTGRALVLHPSPLQTKIIPQRIKETKSTILLATDTFLMHYVRASDDHSLKSLRLAVCGAERVRDETRAVVEERFGCEVLEGYGVTEAAPVIAANQPGDIRAGTVGRVVPSVEVRLDPVEGLDEGGRLFVRGPNIMAGYLSPDQPGVIVPPEEGWYDTGDVVTIDDEGYMAIRGRVKRFAKIGGEMISLTVVENCAGAIWPGVLHAAITLPDPRKGEQIVLVTESDEVDRTRLRTWMQSHGVQELAVPAKIIKVDQVAVLGTGKTDYNSVSKLAKAHLEELAATAEATSEAPAGPPAEPAPEEAPTANPAETVEEPDISEDDTRESA
ncbi:MAG: 2-acylglycerophosphoethanolamine acyltransferase [Alphaproteobacteria bacterium]|nr:MAG: 2-acylglycerophosphoethanolamine acyltransferase [Alphaproteobacteria bacterium]